MSANLKTSTIDKTSSIKMIKSQCYINVLYHVYVVTLVGYQSMLHQIIGDFGVSDAIDEISVWGCKLDFGPA